MWRRWIWRVGQTLAVVPAVLLVRDKIVSFTRPQGANMYPSVIASANERQRVSLIQNTDALNHDQGANTETDTTSASASASVSTNAKESAKLSWFGDIVMVNRWHVTRHMPYKTGDVVLVK
jgi:hypothetical protein